MKSFKMDTTNPVGKIAKKQSEWVCFC